MRKCWYVRTQMMNPANGDVETIRWRIYREWFWKDALDVIKKDVKVCEETYPNTFYDLIEIKEV